MDMPVAHTHTVNLDAAALRAWPLPLPAADAGEDELGHVLVLGGSRERPGAAILAASAALRAGAGKLSIATGASTAQLVALAIPEARVIGLRENAQGGLAREAVAELDPLAGQVSAVLIGPGLQDEAAGAALVRALLSRLAGGAGSVVLDGGALEIALHPGGDAPPFPFERQLIVTLHAGALARLTGIARADILAAPEVHAARAAQRWNAVVALSGARSVISSPEGERWRHEGGNAGLAAAGAGDALAGVIAGLAARGASLAQAACWGVALHALAGDKLASRFGPLGYLAREIADEIPSLMQSARA